MISARIMGGLAALFLAFDATIKVLEPSAALEGTAELGYPSIDAG